MNSNIQLSYSCFPIAPIPGIDFLSLGLLYMSIERFTVCDSISLPQKRMKEEIFDFVHLKLVINMQRTH